MVRRFGLAAALLAGLATGGCVVSETASPYPLPPAPRVEVVPPPPALSPSGVAVWQPGQWVWNGQAYVWDAGHYVATTPGTTRWEPGHWANPSGGPWVWVPGRWV